MIPPVGDFYYFFLVFQLNCVDGGIVPYEGGGDISQRASMLLERPNLAIEVGRNSCWLLFVEIVVRILSAATRDDSKHSHILEDNNSNK
jgi:hypothetical protein